MDGRQAINTTAAINKNTFLNRNIIFTPCAAGKPGRNSASFSHPLPDVNVRVRL